MNEPLFGEDMNGDERKEVENGDCRYGYREELGTIHA